MIKKAKISALFLIAAAILTTTAFAQSKPDSSKAGCNQMTHGQKGSALCDSMATNGKKMMNKHMGMMMKGNKSMTPNSVVRKGAIDLKAIDKNNDGKVFQDVMDWNVISDKPGKCPLCGMKLKEVTLEKAKKNLLKHGYKLKQNKEK